MSWFREQLEHAVHDSGGELGRWTRFLRFQLTLWRFCLNRLRENNLMAMSAALSFRTIFALIPLLVFALLVLKSIGVIEDSKESLRQFLNVSGLARIETVAIEPLEPGEKSDTSAATPSPGQAKDEHTDGDTERKVYNVADEIEAVLASVESKLTFARVGPIGGALLIWTALTLLITIENSLNRIFGAPRSRAVGRRIVIYWSALTLGPVVLALASYLGERMIDTFLNVPVIKYLMVPIGWVGPIIVGILVMSAIYKLLPNTRVKMRAAVGGALVAVPAWLIARWGFTLYIQHLVIKGSLYGVLGVLPLFLLWVNLSWTIFLFGAQLAHTAANLERLQLAELAERITLGPSDVVAAALVVARRFLTGAGPMPFDEICSAINLPGESTQNIMERLECVGIVCPAGAESTVDGDAPAYTLARPPERITAAELIQAGDPRPLEQFNAGDTQLRTLLSSVREKASESLGNATLADMLNGNELAH
ncbi:MAG: YihY family inner membrane protein [Phycisphaerales bacterium]|nr:YihY family inner membrane protein [Phycisphaerales bacterium]